MTNEMRDWMWSEALEMLARAERLHRQAFPPPRRAARGVNWEPPIDVFETEDAVLILVALPGVDAQKVELTIQGDGDHVYRGSIESFDNHIATGSGTIRARARFANVDGSLVPGMFVTVRLGGASQDGALLVPERAIGKRVH